MHAIKERFQTEHRHVRHITTMYKHWDKSKSTEMVLIQEYNKC